MKNENALLSEALFELNPWLYTVRLLSLYPI